MFFYEKNETHFYQKGDNFMITNIINVFPLIMRPFGKYFLPSPAYPNIFLNSIYEYQNLDEVCSRKKENHILVDYLEEKIVTCDLLNEDYIFVNREEVLIDFKNYTKESKIDHRNKIIKTILYEI